MENPIRFSNVQSSALESDDPRKKKYIPGSDIKKRSDRELFFARFCLCESGHVNYEEEETSVE